MHCHFHNPVSIHSGPGMRRQIGALAAKYGKKALIVTTGSAHSRALAEEAGASLEAAGLGWAHYNGIRPTPLGSMTTEVSGGPRQRVRHGHRDRRGSVMDASKASPSPITMTRRSSNTSTGATGRAGPAHPLIATTAGTGSEGN
ncbi:MAG: iron-containing alcohol dehydrogenase [Bilophila wadsworthia]